MAPGGVVAPLEHSALVWGLPLGLLLWGDWPAGTTLAGAAGLYNLHRERLFVRETPFSAPLGRP